jgi:hypothetical protein
LLGGLVLSQVAHYLISIPSFPVSVWQPSTPPLGASGIIGEHSMGPIVTLGFAATFELKNNAATNVKMTSIIKNYS